jgi:hypothetical protein
MNSNVLLVLATMVCVAVGNIVEEVTPPTTVVTLPVLLGSAGNYVILAKTGISTLPDSNIFGDVAVSPIDESAMTGFDMALDSGGQWSTSSQINGKAYAGDYAAPTSSDLTTAVGDMETAYTDAAGRTNGDASRKNVGGGDISGEILTPGVYTFDVNIHFAADIAFNGGRDDIFIIQTTGNLVQATATKVNIWN